MTVVTTLPVLCLLIAVIANRLVDDVGLEPRVHPSSRFPAFPQMCLSLSGWIVMRESYDYNRALGFVCEKNND